MIADLVCASDGLANLGSVAEGSRLNVLLSHHMQVAIVFGDKNYIKCTVTGDARANSKESKNRNYDNLPLIKVFDWMQKNGSFADLNVGSFSLKYVPV